MKKIFSTIITLLLLINLSSPITVLADTALSDNTSNASNTTNVEDKENTSNAVSNSDVSESINADDSDSNNSDASDLSNSAVSDLSNSDTSDSSNSDTSDSNPSNIEIKNTLAAFSNGVTYNAHVSKIGWQNSVSNWDIAGTTGRSLPIEALKISLPVKISGLNLSYQAHVSKIGWQNSVSDGEIAGTTGKSLPIEAIKISLSGLKGYSIQYQVHVKKLGWQNWVADGEIAGTTGKSLPIEAIRIRIVKTIHPESFYINKTSLSLAVGTGDTLISTFNPSNTTNKAVTWQSSNSSVATVDTLGNVTAIAPGTCVITGTSNDGKLTASCNVTVYSIQLQGISLNKSNSTLYVGNTDKLKAIFNPSNATNKKVSWTSSNSSIATVDENGVVKAIKEGTAIIKAVSEDGNFESSCNITVKDYHPSINYQAHCQRIGWQKAVSNGSQAGTTGKSLRMEAIVMNLSDVPKNASINYQVYVQNKGWTNVKKNGETAGYAGLGLRLEAVKISLSNLPGYSVQYRTYVQRKGWMPWVTNGNISGTLGRSLRIEAIQVKLVKSVDISYNTYQQRRGWTGEVHNSSISSTNGQPLRIEAFYAKLNNAPKDASIEYQAYVQGTGWQKFVSNGKAAGTTGKALRIEAINARLVNLPGYTLQYQVFIQNKGWTNWTNGGTPAGTTGKSLRIQGIRMRVIEKPDTTLVKEVYQSSYARTLANYLNSTENIQSVNARAIQLHGGITVNNCVFFSSEALRRTGIYVPTSMCNTGSYTNYLSSIGFVKNYEIDNLAIGDICFSINGSYGYPTHTYVFMGWVNPDDHTQAYVADNQAGTIHIRSMIQTSEHDAFAYSMHK